MTDITSLFGGVFSVPTRAPEIPVEQQILDAMQSAGITRLPNHIKIDGNFHRFASGNKGQGKGGKDTPGWYIFFPDGIPAGRFGCWRADIDMPWRADIGRKLTAAEEMALAQRAAEAKSARDREKQKLQSTSADIGLDIWNGATPASADHPYLARKKVHPHGARVTGDGRLVLPMYSADGTLVSLQFIEAGGGKKFHENGIAKNVFWMLGALDTPGMVYVAEGFATAATIHEVSGRPCAIAYSAANLPAAVGILREHYGPLQPITIVADHDAGGVGKKYAEQACAQYGVFMVMPPKEGDDANDFYLAGGDLVALLSPPEDPWLIPADDFSQEPAPIRWLIKSWVQSDALMMVHGPSGAGKSFVVLDWCLRMASGMADWSGCKVNPSAVVYLAGEGHHGLRGRIAAWKHHHHVDRLRMWLSRDGCDLNTPGGYLRVSSNIKRLPETPALIVVDTLHRFLHGDENSAMDAKTMLDACNNLMREIGCAVLLVHHTGVSDEAQHRARGSSAWRGALDLEISVIPSKKDGPMQIVQRKSKDAEIASSVYVELQSVTIPGWKDEDGDPVTSAVIVPAEAPAKEKKESDIQQDIRKISNAWWASGAEESEGSPYVSRSALLDYLMTSEGLSESTAKTYVKPSQPGRLVYNLLTAQVILAKDHGWIIFDQATAAALLMAKNASGE